jgi:hypothetical protein
VSVLRRTWSFSSPLHFCGTKPVTSTLSKTEQTLISQDCRKRFAYPTPSTFGRTASVILDMAFTSRLIQGEAQSNHVSVRSESSRSHRSRPLRSRFVHRDTDAIDVCVQELEKAQFTVSSDRALNPAQSAEQPSRMTSSSLSTSIRIATDRRCCNFFIRLFRRWRLFF